MKKPGAEADLQAAVSARAWELVKEIYERGQVTLRPLDGAKDDAATKVIPLKDRHLLTAVIWGAGLTAKKKVSRTTLRTLADDVELEDSR